ncbi:nuclear pore protein-like protein [Colletotrichum plurivorum]|uniref:Nuclear pore protein-like protein n=1 Tax=Colletotrichum plurivorum TaxID=2175906 RepID=A0A8H6NI42_9PEZI|nr:nuclear pore protein-like protein [Colletotrichum plurivorum]
MPRAGKRAATSEIRSDARFSRRKTSHTPPASPEEIPVAVKSESDDSVQSEPDESVAACESIDKYGDLILRVGPGRKSYRVCSRTLARASPVFDAMLYGPSADSRPLADQWTINLPDDGHAETRAFLRISHGQSASVPSTLPISGLCRLLHLLEKYDAIPVIRPWIQGWLKHVGGNTKDLRLLWISWTTGDSNLFRTVLRKVAESLSIDEGGNLEYDDATLRDPEAVSERRLLDGLTRDPAWLVHVVDGS